MPNQELVEYIKKAKEAGQSKEQITRELISAGWRANDIETTMTSLHQSDVQIKPATDASHRSQGQKEWQGWLKRIVKLLIGGFIGYVISAVVYNLAALCFFGACSPYYFLSAPIRYIFYPWHTYLVQYAAVVNFLGTFEYIAIGILIVFLLDKTYHFITKLVVLVIFIIIVFIPYFVYQYNITVINNINENSKIETCNSFSFSFFQPGEKCLLNLVDKTNNSDICKQLVGEDNQMQCFVSIAVNTKNEKMCFAIESYRFYRLDYLNNCISSVVAFASQNIKDTNDLGLCLKMDSGVTRNKCFYDMAINTKNKKLCDIINTDLYPQNLFLKNNCLYNMELR